MFELTLLEFQLDEDNPQPISLYLQPPHLLLLQHGLFSLVHLHHHSVVMVQNSKPGVGQIQAAEDQVHRVCSHLPFHSPLLVDPELQVDLLCVAWAHVFLQLVT